MGQDLQDQTVPVATVHVRDEASERVVPLRVVASRVAPEDPLQRQAARIDAVYQAAEVIGDDEPSMGRLLRITTQLTGAPAACFSLVAERRSLVRSTLGIDREAAASLWPLDSEVVLQDRLMLGSEVSSKASHMVRTLERRGLSAEGYAGIPIRMPNGLVVGVLSALCAQERTLTPQFQEALADVAALAEDWMLLRSASIVDVLTGLFNRRYFEELVSREWRRSMRHVTPISMLMIDIDYFKKLNDGLGHEAGDVALSQVAGILREQFRRGGDVLARYGGEEFVVVMPDADADAALLRARAACQAVEDAQLSHPDSPFEAITVSIGVSTASSGEDRARGPLALLNRADQALYEAKHKGRNRAVFDSASAYR